MTNAEARLRRRKARLTNRLRRRDLRHQKWRGITNDSSPRRIQRHQPRKRTIHRARIYKTDLALESFGVFAPLNVAGLWEDGWLVGAVRMPGQNADYRGGRVIFDGAIVHYTVGTDSRGPGLRGLFCFLISEDGTIWQFGQVGGVFWHACEFNHRTVGVETEKLLTPEQQPTTDAQIASWGRILAGLWQLGVPRSGPEGVYRNGIHDVDYRVAVLPQILLAHRTLIHQACDQHSDYLLNEEIAKVVAVAESILGESSGDDDRRRKAAALC